MEKILCLLVKRQPHEENLKFKNKNKENEILSI